MARKRRCIVADEETGRRCHRFGEGTPALCNIHDAKRIVEELMEYPEVRDGVQNVVDAVDKALLGRVRSVLDRAAGFIDHLGRGRPDPTQGGPPPGPNGASRRPPPPRLDPQRVARVALHFEPDEPLTRDKIKSRHKALSLALHPDAGGSDTAQAKLNAARDILLKAIT